MRVQPFEFTGRIAVDATSILYSESLLNVIESGLPSGPPYLSLIENPDHGLFAVELLALLEFFHVDRRVLEFNDRAIRQSNIGTMRRHNHLSPFNWKQLLPIQVPLGLRLIPRIAFLECSMSPMPDVNPTALCHDSNPTERTYPGGFWGSLNADTVHFGNQHKTTTPIQ
jgi:hypothetical protein